MIKEVVISKKAQKQLKKMPSRIAIKLDDWIEFVEEFSLEEARKIKGYHDEPLKGRRRMQRSIRLSIHYRAIYEIKNQNYLEFVSIEEVNKHEY